MKLKQKTLVALVRPLFKSMGFTCFKDTISGVSTLFCKKIKDDLYLSIGMNINRFYDSMFTCDMYLSRTTNFASLWGDIPRESYRRPGFFLTQEELKTYSTESNLVRDIWWNASSVASISSFAKTLDISVPRFCKSSEIVDKIYASKDVAILAELSHEVITKIKNNEYVSDNDYKFVPKKEIDGIPLKWFWATEEVVAETLFYNKHGVRFIASDAYRQCILNETVI